jgi:hypothetical protein
MCFLGNLPGAGFFVHAVWVFLAGGSCVGQTLFLGVLLFVTLVDQCGRDLYWIYWFGTGS